MLDKKNYVNGQKVYELKNDRLTYFFKTGITKAEGAFIKNQMQGEWKFYRENGELWQIGNFKNNLKHGKFIRYNKRGTIEYEADFDTGKVKSKGK
ncbi:MAG: hypothetical protein JWO32_2644 [Bacteroidetes bacterium]|nr:hypothetical protein [Bacteroidota bacterium]